jgi:hypothetical protein
MATMATMGHGLGEQSSRPAFEPPGDILSVKRPGLAVALSARTRPANQLPGGAPRDASHASPADGTRSLFLFLFLASQPTTDSCTASCT